MRCTQKVHFSITPRERTVTSGLYCISRSTDFWYLASTPESWAV